MKLKFDFSNGIPSVEFNENTDKATPLELLVPETNGISGKNSLDLYIKSLDYLFRGVSNYASGKIVGVSAEKGWFGKIEKQREEITWQAISDKNFVVVYDITLHAISEHMYVADAITRGGKTSFKGVDPIWIKELLVPNPTGMKENIISSVTIATDFLTEYKLAWGFGGKEGLSIINGQGQVIDVGDIADDEAFILIKLLMLLMSKGTHMGVFLINCRGFSDKVLEGLVKTAEVFFGDAYIFFYNVSPRSQIKRSAFVLPNILAN